MKLRTHSKGYSTLWQAMIAGVLLVSLGITLSVGSDIVDSIRDTVRRTATATNETVTITANEGTLAHGYTIGELTECYNNTADMTPTTFTIPDQCNITTTNADDADSVVIGVSGLGAGTSVNVTYSYDTREAASRSAHNSTTGLINVSKWQPTMGTIIAASVIISILMTSFIIALRRKKVY